ncbi:MAG TPA: lysophospholipid acyltransferase family protein [Acidobacteriaceae bacterium]|jgi:KDO2-lipid IV(A) lauroyltransferase|nr:lysophospholipid acyltransferase family protein [Acidobacteriaceae bacterium]
MRNRLEFILAWTLFRLLGLPPRPVARRIGAAIGACALLAVPRLRRTGRRNLEIALPQLSPAERERVLRFLYRNLGWLLAEFCQMPRYTRENTASFLRYDGLEHYLAARAEGKGVLIITAHLGAWELSSFYHSLMGYPMSIVIRRLDNPFIDNLVNRIRCLHGNQVLHKDDFARGLLASMRRGETVGILMDTNMTPPQGVFVDFFGLQACTGSGLARVAMKTGARVLPGFLLWEQESGQYVLRFGAPIPLQDTGDFETDLRDNTAAFTRQIEIAIRQYPDQWLWVHRRWKTRPPGDPPVYT